MAVAKTLQTEGNPKKNGASEPKGIFTRDEPQQECSKGTPTEPKNKHSKIETSRSEDSEVEGVENLQFHWQHNN